MLEAEISAWNYKYDYLSKYFNSIDISQEG